jgi:hypothetical protein
MQITNIIQKKTVAAGVTNYARPSETIWLEYSEPVQRSVPPLLLLRGWKDSSDHHLHAVKHDGDDENSLEEYLESLRVRDREENQRSSSDDPGRVTDDDPPQCGPGLRTDLREHVAEKFEDGHEGHPDSAPEGAKRSLPPCHKEEPFIPT